MNRNSSHLARWAVRSALTLAAAGFWIGIVDGGSARSVASATPSIKDSPGYVPVVDPESTSVALGRRANAPLVKAPFHGGAHSLDELGRLVCRSLHHTVLDSMLALCVKQDEFRDVMWREFPESRPATGLTWQDAWIALDMRLKGGCASGISDWGGHHYEFLGFKAGTVNRFRNFKLHRGLTMTVKDDEGKIQQWGWLRTVAERNGRFKIYSMKD